MIDGLKLWDFYKDKAFGLLPKRFTLYLWCKFQVLKSLESLVNLVRLYKKVSKSRETFKVRDFVNTSSDTTNKILS